MGKMNMKGEWQKIIEAMKKVPIKTFEEIVTLVEDFNVLRRYGGSESRVYIGDTVKYIDDDNKVKEYNEVIAVKVAEGGRKLLHCYQPINRDEKTVKLHTFALDGMVGRIVDHRNENHRYSFVYQDGQVTKIHRIKLKPAERERK